MAAMPAHDNADTIRARLAAVGVEDSPDGSVIVMAVTDNIIRHFGLDEIGATDPAGADAMYVATGLFTPGKVVRQRTNLTRIPFLGFDADLIDHEGVEESEIPEFRESAQAVIDQMIALQLANVKGAFAEVGIPIHRVDYSGYGLAIYTLIDQVDQTRIDDIVAAQKRIIAGVNAAAKMSLLDSGTSDAGTRVLRIPGSFNNKGSTPREVRTLLYEPDRAAYRITDRAVTVTAPTPVTINTVGLSPRDLKALIDACRPYHVEPHRHLFARSLAAFIGKVGVPEEQTLFAIAAIAEGDEELADRLRAVRDTYTKLRTGQMTQGWTLLRDLMTANALEYVDGILERYREATKVKGQTPTVTVRDAETRGAQAISDADAQRKRDIAFVDRLTPIPDQLFYGWFGRYRDVMGPSTEAADAFHLGAILTIAGAMIGRGTGMLQGSDVIYPNLFTVLVGASGWSRKDTAIDRALDHFTRRPPSTDPNETYSAFFAETTDITSAEGILEELNDAPEARLLARISEITTIFANMERQGTKNLGDRLIRLWDNPATTQVSRRSNSTRVERPSVSIIGATQPGRLAESMTHQHVISGMANRIIFISGTRKCEMFRPPSVDVQMSWQLYKELCASIGHTKGKLLRLAAETDDICEAWYHKVTNDATLTEESESMRSRHQTMANKIALIYAVSDRADQVYLRHMEPAIAFVEWMWSNLLILMKTWGISNFTHIQQKIESTLRERGPLSKRRLSQLCSNRRWTITEYNLVLNALHRSERVIVDVDGLVSVPEESANV